MIRGWGLFVGVPQIRSANGVTPLNPKALKVALAICGIACAIALGGVFLPWSAVEKLAGLFGPAPLPEGPVAEYWFRLACAALGLSGVFFLLLARDPLRYEPLLGLFFVGLVCLVMGTLIFVLWRRTVQKR